MANAEVTEDSRVKSTSRKPLLIGCLIAIVGGGAGFYLVYSGSLAFPESSPEAVANIESLPDVGFVALDPLVISLGPASRNRHLKFSAQLEVERAFQADVELLKPRVIDVLNSYLRALETSDLEDPSALTRLRTQMLRRVQLVTGEGRVRDILIMEFVLN